MPRIFVKVKLRLFLLLTSFAATLIAQRVGGPVFSGNAIKGLQNETQGAARLLRSKTRKEERIGSLARRNANAGYSLVARDRHGDHQGMDRHWEDHARVGGVIACGVVVPGDCGAF
jgi:hypothetical protein